MKYWIYIFFLFIPFSPIQSQQLIAGIVKDTLGNPLPGVYVSQERQKYTPYTDIYGAFHIVLDSTIAPNLYFWSYGYKDLTIENADTISEMLTIELSPWDTIPDPYNPSVQYNTIDNPVGVSFGIQFDFFDHNFEQFEGLLGADNVDMLNKPVGVLNYELAFTGKRNYFGFFWGMWSNKKDIRDIEIQRNYTLLGLRYGYRLINSKRIILMPDIRFQQYTYRLFNSSNDEDIPLVSYILDRELDLRISQSMLAFGLNLAFKFKGKNSSANEYFTFGGYGAYGIKVYNSPSLNSKRNTLETDQKIDIEHFNYGLFLTMNFE